MENHPSINEARHAQVISFLTFLASMMTTVKWVDAILTLLSMILMVGSFFLYWRAHKEPMTISKKDWTEYILLKQVIARPVGVKGQEIIARTAGILAENIERNEEVANMAMKKMMEDLAEVMGEELEERVSKLKDMVKEDDEDEDEQPEQAKPEPGQDVQNKEPQSA